MKEFLELGISKGNLHQLKRNVMAHLSKDLRQKYNLRSAPIRKGDTVKVMRGSAKGMTGKIIKVERINSKGALKPYYGNDIDGQFWLQNVAYWDIDYDENNKPVKKM